MNKKFLNKKDFKISLILTLLSAIGIILTILGQIDSIPTELLETMSKAQLIAISFGQSVVMAFILSFIGLKLSRAAKLNNGLLGCIYADTKDNKEKYKLNSKNIIISILTGFVFSSITVLSEKFIWGPMIPEIGETVFTFDPLYLFSGIFYGGILEEVMLRLFFMSLIIFLLFKIFVRKNKNTNIPSSIYWIAIFIAALLFALGHLPLTMITFSSVTSIVIIRMLLMNGLAGVIFGYLYWKKGIEYAMIAHIFYHIFTQSIWMPILF